MNGFKAELMFLALVVAPAGGLIGWIARGLM